jgi:hypothetical protein
MWEANSGVDPLTVGEGFRLAGGDAAMCCGLAVDDKRCARGPVC